jgi:NAD-dependent SIR2 family protein deacetylase
MLKKPAGHIILMRCGECKERFQTKANPEEDKYTCPHCEAIVEYECYRTGPVVGPSEAK